MIKSALGNVRDGFLYVFVFAVTFLIAMVIIGILTAVYMHPLITLALPALWLLGRMGNRMLSTGKEKP
jgi:hypothetical protein